MTTITSKSNTCLFDIIKIYEIREKPILFKPVLKATLVSEECRLEVRFEVIIYESVNSIRQYSAARLNLRRYFAKQILRVHYEKNL